MVPKRHVGLQMDTAPPPHGRVLIQQAAMPLPPPPAAGAGGAAGGSSTLYRSLNTTVWVYPPFPSTPMTYAALLSDLSTGRTVAVNGTRLASLLGVSKLGLSGNGICEVGEISINGSTGEDPALLCG
jgi:hypothetical protein